jgi:membrane-associated phospholipid phosphatase
VQRLTQLPLAQILPQFDRRSRFVYAMIVGTAAVGAVLFAGMGFQLKSGPSLQGAAVIALFILSAAMFRRAGWERTATALEVTLLIMISGSIIFVLQFPLAAIAMGPPDELLLASDRLLGFDWRSFSGQFQTPVVVEVLRQAYRSMIPQTAICVTLLAYAGRTNRTWQFCTGVFLCLLLSVAPFPFFAAEGLHVGCGHGFSDIMVEDTCNFASAIRKGLVSFPSGHSAAALLLVWAVWPIRLMRIPSLLLNILMSIGAIVIGKHYLVDILGGYLLAWAAIVVVVRILPDRAAEPRS